jgi:hypothetical protein
MIAARQIFLGTSQGGNAMQLVASLIDRSITTVPSPELITEIGAFAFAGCTNLTTGTFQNCTKISQGSFLGCSALTELSLPSCTTIDTTVVANTVQWNNSGIADCSGIVNLNMPSLLITSYNCFKDMKQLRTVHIESCTVLNDIVFSNSSAIEQVYCPNVSSLVSRSFGYLGDIAKDVYFYMTQRTTTQILAMSLGSHFGSTPTAKWTLFHFIGSDGSVDYDTSTSSWVATPNA